MKTFNCINERKRNFGQCMENCFWNWAQKRANMTCLIPTLLNDEANLTKPKCRDEEEEMIEEKKLWKVIRLYADEPGFCDCPRRCKFTDYHISADPAGTCRTKIKAREGKGFAYLLFSFPSKRVRSTHFRPQIRTTSCLPSQI